MGGRIEAVAAAMECTDCLLCSVVTMARWGEQVGCFIGSAEARGRRRSRRCSGAFAIPPLPARARFQARTRGDSRAFLLPARARLSWGGCGCRCPEASAAIWARRETPQRFCVGEEMVLGRNFGWTDAKTCFQTHKNRPARVGYIAGLFLSAQNST